MSDTFFATPELVDSHPRHPDAHRLLRMFFQCLDELPDDVWGDIRAENSPEGSHGLIRRASCACRGLWLRAESAKSLSKDHPYADARWSESATFFDGPHGRRPLARFEILGRGKFNPAADPRAALARIEVDLSICVFDAQGEPAQMTSDHWLEALDLLDLEGCLGEALETLRQAPSRFFEDFKSRLQSARSAAVLSAENAANGSDD